MSDRRTRLAGLCAAVAAVVAVAVSPLLALSYFGIDDGADELESGTVSAWAEPARDALGGLLTWASPDRVYATYVQALGLALVASFLCALVVHSRRTASGRAERWGWRIALAGYGLTGVGLAAAFVLLFGGSTAGTALDVVYLALMFPGMAISAIGSTVLGVGLVRDGYTPRATAWLLTLALPSMLFVPDVLGHNSLGLLPIPVAWGITGLRLWRALAPRAFEPEPAGGDALTV